MPNLSASSPRLSAFLPKLSAFLSLSGYLLVSKLFALPFVSISGMHISVSTTLFKSNLPKLESFALPSLSACKFIPDIRIPRLSTPFLSGRQLMPRLFAILSPLMSGLHILRLSILSLSDIHMFELSPTELFLLFSIWLFL